MYNKQRNCNNAFTLDSIPLNQRQGPSRQVQAHPPKRHILVPEDEDRKLTSHRKDSSDGYTYYQTHPYQFHEEYREEPTSVELESDSGCPSIENGIFQNMLVSLQEEIKLKSKAFGLAESIVKREEENLRALEKENRSLREQLDAALKKIQNLQLELLHHKSRPSPLQSTTKKSITKTYITQKSISPPENTQPLKLISSQIFNEFARSFETLVNELSSWISKEREEELENSVLSKVQMHKVEVQELLYGKFEQEYSKTTYETLFDNNEKDWSKKLTGGCNSYNEYEQVVDMYKDYCTKLSAQLHESLNFIQQLSKALQKSQSLYTRTAQPQTLIPSELISLVTRQCNKIINNKFSELKNQNLELINIIQEMIAWIEKNSRDGGERFRSSFSAVL